MMGGGFGGCALHLVQEDRVDQFMHEVIDEYEREFDLNAQAFCLEPVAGARSDRPPNLLHRSKRSNPMLGSRPTTQDEGLPRDRRTQ